MAPQARCKLPPELGGLMRRDMEAVIHQANLGREDEKIAQLVEKNFDLRPAAIIRDLDLRRPIYRQTAAYGHFGRTDIDLPWEHTDKAETLRKQAGL